MDRQRAIGYRQRLPWRLSADLRNFKKITMGKPIVMGRRTRESIGRSLPERENIVLSRDRAYQAEGCTVLHSLEELFSRYQYHDELVVIGGAGLYAEVLWQAQRLYLTEVDAEVAGDTFFPEFDRSAWREVSRERFSADERNEFDYSFVVLDRID